MVQVIRVYNTKENAILGGTGGIINSATVDGGTGAIHNSEDTIPYYIYKKYFYRIDSNEPATEFHIDWDDGEDNSDEKRNIQEIKLETPAFFCIMSHVYTDARRYFPLIRVKSLDGYLCKWYTSQNTNNEGDSIKAFEPYATQVREGITGTDTDENFSSQLSYAGGGLIPHFVPSNLSPIGILKVDKKEILSGIDNKTIDTITDYPLLYIYSTASSKPDIKLTIQGRKDRAIREYTCDSTNIIATNTDLDNPTTDGIQSEMSLRAFPSLNYDTGSAMSLNDCAGKLLKAELLNHKTLGDNDRVYIKVFDAVASNLSGNVDIATDDTVCILSNGSPIIDLAEDEYIFTADASESFTRSSGLSISEYLLEDDSLANATIQSQAALSSKIGNMSDELHSSSSLGTKNQKKLSYAFSNVGDVKDSDTLFIDSYRLLRLQVKDNHAIITGSADKSTRLSKILHYDDAQYASTEDNASNASRIPSSEASQGLLLYANAPSGSTDTSLGEMIATWNDCEAISRTNATIIGGSATSTVLRQHTSGEATILETGENEFTVHPKNHLLLCQTEAFDSVHFRVDNTYLDTETPKEIDIMAFYSTTNGWEPLEIVDDTRGLKVSGSVRFKRPSDWDKTNSAGIESGTWTGPVPATDSTDTGAQALHFTLSVEGGNFNGSGASATEKGAPVETGADGLSSPAISGTPRTRYGSYFEFSSPTVDYYMWFRQAARKEMFTIECTTSPNDTMADYVGATITLYDTLGSDTVYWMYTGSETVPTATRTSQVNISAATKDEEVASILELLIENTANAMEGVSAAPYNQFNTTYSAGTDNFLVECDIAGPVINPPTNNAAGNNCFDIEMYQDGYAIGLNPSGAETYLASGRTAIICDYVDLDRADTIQNNIVTALNAAIGTGGGSLATISEPDSTTVKIAWAAAGAVADPFTDGQTDTLTLDSDFAFAVTQTGIAASDSVNDPQSKWTFNAYGVLFSFSCKETTGDYSKVNIKNVWPYNNSHSQLIKIKDSHHLSLNSISKAQSISFSRRGKHISITDRFGKSQIRKIGATGGSLKFGGMDLGDTDATGNRKKLKHYQQNSIPVYLDVTHTSGEITRFFGVITNMSEDHPTGRMKPKFSITMQISHLIELNSSGVPLSDKISIGGIIDGSRKHISSG